MSRDCHQGQNKPQKRSTDNDWRNVQHDNNPKNGHDDKFTKQLKTIAAPEAKNENEQNLRAQLLEKLDNTEVQNDLSFNESQ